MNNSTTKLPLGPLMVDVAGLTLSESERKQLLLPTVGAVILFTRNYESKSQVSELINEIKCLRSPSLLIAVDQEGGRVQRFRNGFFPLPAMQFLGHCFHENPSHGLSLSHDAGRLMAFELAEIGVDFSFAPVLDIYNRDSQVIGDRSFDACPKTISTLAASFISGMNDAGMAATGKHFPGHGGVLGDSHIMSPIDPRSMAELEPKDLYPFIQLAKQLGGIMTAHVSFPNIDSDLPTFSSFWINQVLRQKIGFQGVVFSDDLSMKGAHEAGTVLERTAAALGAGCDMALICNDPDNAQMVATQLPLDSTFDSEHLEKMRLCEVKRPLSEGESGLDALRKRLHDACSNANTNTT